MTDENVAGRLQRLEQVLAQSSTAPNNSGSRSQSPDEVLHGIRTERIRLLTAELRLRADNEADALDAVMMRLLLDDYAAAVAHLRAMASVAKARTDQASATIREGRNVTQLTRS